MSVISDLLGAIRSRRQVKFASVSERYDSFVSQLAKGQDVDIDELATMMDELDKSDSDLQQDVSLKQRRFEAAEHLGHLREVAKTLPKLESDLERLESELRQLIAEKQPVINGLRESVKATQLEVQMIAEREHELQTIGIPLHLATRRDELMKKRKVWAESQREYESKVAAPRDHVRQIRGRLEVFDRQISRAKGEDVSDLQTQRKSLVDAQQAYQNQIDNLSQFKQQLDAELREIEREEREIQKLLMQP